MRKKAILIIILGLLFMGLTSGCGKKENNDISFDENLIISNLTINEVKLSQLMSVNDILTKIKGSKKTGVTVCYDNADECKYYPNNEFYDGEKDKNISTISIAIRLNESDRVSTSINYWLYYDRYKNNIDNAPYFKLEFVDMTDLIMLDNKPIKNYNKEELDNKFKITKTAFGDRQYIYEFENSINDKISLSGYFGGNNIEIFNYGERDKGAKS